MKYILEAAFTDGVEFRQPADDSSALMPGVKSAMYDFLEFGRGRTLNDVSLIGEGHVYTAFQPVDELPASFGVDGVTVQPGDALPEGLEWVEGDPAQGCYFRTRRFFSDGTETTQFCIGVQYAPGIKNFLGVY